MSDQQIDVRIRAQNGELKRGMEESVRVVEDASKRMEGSLDGVESSTSSISVAFEQLKAKMSEAFDSMKAQMRGVGDQMSDLHNHISAKSIAIGLAISAAFAAIGLGALYTVFKIAKETISWIAGLVTGSSYKSENIDKTKEALKLIDELRSKLGLTENQALATADALDRLGVSQESYIAVMNGLREATSGNTDEMDRLGVKYKDINGKLLEGRPLLENIKAKLDEYTEGWDRNKAAAAIGAGSYKQVVDALKVTDKEIDSSKSRLAEYNLLFSKNGVEAVDRYNAAMREFEAESKKMSQGFSRAISDNIMPVLTDLAEWFRDGWPKIVNVFRGGLATITTLFYVFKTTIYVVAETILGIVQSIGEALGGIGGAAVKLFKGDFAGAVDELKAGGDRAVERLKQIGDNVAAQVRENRKATELAWAADDRTYGLGGGSKGSSWVPKPKEDKSGGDKSRMAEFEAELAKRRDAVERQSMLEGSLREYSKKEESDYWKSVSQYANLSTSDRAKVMSKYYASERVLRTEAFQAELTSLKIQSDQVKNDYGTKVLIAEEVYQKIVRMYGAESKQAKEAMGQMLDERRKLVEQTQQLALMESQSKRKWQELDIDLAKQEADYLMSQQLISNAQMLGFEREFEERRYQMKLEAAKEELALTDATQDPVKYRQLKEQIEQVEREHQLKLKQIKLSINAEGNKPEVEMFKTMEDAYSRAITGMITRTQTLRQTLTALYQNIFQSFVTEMVSKPLAQIMARAVRESSVYQMLSAVAIGNQAKASATTTAMIEGETAPKLTAIAPVAAAGAAESQASIPYVGPILAAAAFAAMFAMVLGAGKGSSSTTTTTRLPSASGGWDIPAGINPLAQLHEQEMVLPSEQAEAVRNMAAGSHAPIVINTSGGDFIHKRDLVKLLKTMNRDYRLK